MSASPLLYPAPCGPGTLNRIPSARARAAIRLPATSFRCRAPSGNMAPAGVSRSFGVPTTDNPCCRVPTFDSHTTGQMIFQNRSVILFRARELGFR